jgi:hypothetical protein
VAERTQADVVRLVPAGETVLVVSRGDEQLVELDGRRGWHFPQAESGVYAGHHPQDGADAVAQLELLRGRGAGHLVIPATSSWWLEHYEDFREHLDLRYQQVASDPDSCVIYRLDPSPAANGGGQ